MDQQAATLLATLRRTSAASDAKLTQLNNLKSDIKHHRVPESAQPTIFECLRYAIAQQSSSTLATAALTTFSHLIKRLKIQDPEGASIAAHAPKLLPALQERLGDLRESHRAGASQALTDIWPFCGHDVEDLIRDEAIAGNNVRAKDAGMQWVVKMNHEASLPFKGFVPLMVLNLEDADGTVRDSAKSALINLFKNAPDRAKADLKKQLNMHSVRAGIAAQVLSNIETSAPPEPNPSSSTRSVPTFDPRFTESITSEAARPPPQEEVPMDPIYMQTQRELEDTIQDMMPFFEGRESEENWISRDKSVTKLRRITKGNAPTDYYNAYMAGIKQMQEGIIKVANSLRTTTSTNACLLVQELARTLGPALDPMVEIYAQNFIKMSAVTKHIAAQNGMHTVDTLFQYVSCNARIMQHIWFAAQDKNVQPRTFTATWLRTVLSRQSGSKTHFEHIGGLELAEKTIKKALNDPQPKVKESMRATYWTFSKIWPERAKAIMNTLDVKAQAALEKDPHNPNALSVQSQLGGSTRAATTSRAQSRSSVRDAILAARKNMNKQQNDRPSSAMAAPTLSPPVPRSKSSHHLSVRQPSGNSSSSSRVPSNSSSTSQTDSATPSASAVRPNSLMSGAARRPIRKPEPPRPATADPYASRRLLRPETPSNKSPANSPRQDTLGRAAASAARKKHEAETPIPSPGPQRTSPPRDTTEPRPSSKDGKTTSIDEPSLTKEEDFTMVIPSRSRQTSPVATRPRPAIEKTASVDSGIPTVAEDDSFALVMPTALDAQQPRSPILTRETPHRAMSEDAPHAHLPPSARSSFSQRTRRPSDRADDVSSPKARAPSVPRQGSPLKTSTAAPLENFQIHEDAVNGGAEAPQPNSPSPQEVRVLNELPVNESSNQEARSPLQEDEDRNNATSPTVSSETKVESIRSRKLLVSGIERIKSRTLDAHGFRKVLELVRSSDSGDIFGTVGEWRRFDDLCSALLEYIVDPSSEAAGSSLKHSHELKRQAIAILRTVISKQQSQYKKWISSGRWNQRILAGTFDARKGIEGLSLLVKDLESLTSDVAAKVHPEEGERAVLTWLEHSYDEAQNDIDAQQDGIIERLEAKSHARANALALRTLSSLLAANKAVSVLADISTRIAKITAACLRSFDAEVRKAAVELATELHESWPPAAVASETKNEYWSLLEKSGVQESARNLIVYFIARRAKGV